MRRELAAYLWDLHEAVSDIRGFTHGIDLAGFGRDRLVRAGVERKFEIIGEAPKQMAQHYPSAAVEFSSFKGLVGFRDVLIHQYAYIKDIIV